MPTRKPTALEKANAKIKELKAELHDWEKGHELRWKADMRAIKMWREETGEKLVWPDHAELVVWLLGKLAPSDRPTEGYKHPCPLCGGAGR